MNTVTFTSTIQPDILEWTNSYAEQTKQTRREVLEDALSEYRLRKTKKLLKDSFTRAAQDMDMQEMAEWGMDDYSNIVK